MSIFKSVFRRYMAQRSALGHYGRDPIGKWEFFKRTWKVLPQLLLETLAFRCVSKSNETFYNRAQKQQTADDLSTLLEHRYTWAVRTAYFRNPKAPGAITVDEFRAKFRNNP